MSAARWPLSSGCRMCGGGRRSSTIARTSSKCRRGGTGGSKRRGLGRAPGPAASRLALPVLLRRALSNRLLLGGRELGFHFLHAPLELLKPSPDRASDLGDPLRPEDEEHDEEEPEELLWPKIEHSLKPPL